MGVEDETFVAATEFVRNLARNGNSTSIDKISLPGPDTAGKRAYESELAALQARISHLTKVAGAGTQTFPMTPNEPPAYPFDSLSNRNGTTSSNKPRTSTSYPSQVSDFMLPRDDDDLEGRQVSGEDLNYVRDFVQKQAEEIKTHRDVIADVSKRLDQQKDKTNQSLERIEQEDVLRMQRELKKHQQANDAFQKALREIGSVITNVANGDLNSKVIVYAIEMDPEITKFKRTSEAETTMFLEYCTKAL